MGDNPTPPDPRWYDPGYRPQQLGNRQARYISARERARAKALLPPPEPVIRDRQCRICQRQIAFGRKWYCEACRANLNNGFNHRIVAARRAAGLCVRCGELAVDGRTCCVRCRDKARQRYKPGTNRAASKRLEHRKARYVCTVCTAAVATGRLRCEACLLDSRDRHRRERTRWRDSGVCVGCGRTPKRGKLCGVCGEREKKLRATNQAAGYCRCGRFRVPGRKGCAGCLTRSMEYQRRRRAAAVKGPK